MSDKIFYCIVYPKSEVLPDEDENCSLCGGSMSEEGECKGTTRSSSKLRQQIDWWNHFGDYIEQNSYREYACAVEYANEQKKDDKK